MVSENAATLITWGVGILLAIIGFFVSFYFVRSIKKQDENTTSINETHKELSGSINKLQLAITGLNGVILSMQQSNDTFTKGCRDKHSHIDKKLDEHARILDEHGKKLVEFDVKINNI